MKVKAWFIVVLLWVAACGAAEQAATSTQNQIQAPASGTLPAPSETRISAPDPSETARTYLNAWAERDYATMYAMLTTLSQDAMPLETFEARYRNIETEANLNGIEYDILQSLLNPNDAEVGYRITLFLAVFGPITRETTMHLSRQGQEWRVIWDDTLILPELAGGNTLSMVGVTPTRGNIYDRNGSVIAAHVEEAYALTVIPSNIGEDDGDGLVNQLAALTGLNVNYLADLILQDNLPFFVPIGEVPSALFNERVDFLEPYINSLRWESYSARLYYNGGIAPQSVGWFGTIPAEDVETYLPLGYPIDAKIGRMGIENWAEAALSGKRGGTLYVISPEDEIVTLLEAIGPTPADSVYLTLDKDLQYEAQLAIKDFTGAIVVLEKDTGRILAMVSSPGFNPNASDPNNFNSQFLWGDIVSDPNQPFFNRATQGQYPPGSIFKPITLAAALESGMYTVEHEIFCGAEWTGLPGTTLEDWTLSHDLPPSGQLTLLEGLMRSCNPYYYDIGLSLYSNGFADLVAEIARGFGLGSATNLEVLPEATGQITNPNDNPDASTRAFEAVQQAFGQGTTLITPLQAAVYVAAIGNGGTLYRPQMIERIESTSGFVSLEFQPDANGSLPVTQQNLTYIQTAMRMVVANPRGTAYRRFGGLQIPVSGKTGTASVSDPNLEPHAWFIGYTSAGREDLPDIAIAVIVENVGDGSDFAAPIFRRVLEAYFFGRPQVSYPWESRVGVLATPEPEDEDSTDGADVVQTPEP